MTALRLGQWQRTKDNKSKDTTLVRESTNRCRKPEPRMPPFRNKNTAVIPNPVMQAAHFQPPNRGEGPCAYLCPAAMPIISILSLYPAPTSSPAPSTPHSP